MTIQQINGIYGAKTIYTDKLYSKKEHVLIESDVIAKLKENTLFSVNILGQDINTIVYNVNGIKIKATGLLK